MCNPKIVADNNTKIAFIIIKNLNKKFLKKFKKLLKNS